MAVFRESRYTQTPAYTKRGGSLILSVRERVHFNVDNATYYTVTQGDTLDGIAYAHYGNAQFGWAILDANSKYQSELELKPGDVIVIPSYDEVVRASE